MIDYYPKIKILLLSFCILTSCDQKKVIGKSITTNKSTTKTHNRKGLNNSEIDLIHQGLINIKWLDASFKVDLRYSTPNNFVGIDLYGELNEVYLHPEVAIKLKKAQKILKDSIPNYSLLIFDGVRPLHIQQLMWDTLKIPFSEKIKFLSNPSNHSLHNYGAAVDLTIVDASASELDMGTPYDYIGELAYPKKETELLAKGELSQQQVTNRKLLRYVMKKAGFMPITTEWWHFNSCYRKEAKENYRLIE